MAERIVRDVPARAARSGPEGACRVRQTQIDAGAGEFTANDTSLRFWDAARAGRRQPETVLAHSCSPARNTPTGRPRPQAMLGPALRAIIRPVVAGLLFP